MSAVRAPCREPHWPGHKRHSLKLNRRSDNDKATNTSSQWAFRFDLSQTVWSLLLWVLLAEAMVSVVIVVIVAADDIESV